MDSRTMNPESRESLTGMGASQGSYSHTLPVREAILAAPNTRESPMPGPPLHTITELADDTPAKHGLAGAQPEVQLFTLLPPRRTRTPSDSSDNCLPEFEPAEYIEEHAANPYLAYYVGTAAYYKSRKFKKKEADRKVQVSGPDGNPATSSGRVAETSKVSRSLVMIFGTNNVRRASLQRKFETRLQKTNQRMKAWRKLQGKESMFGWD